MSQGPFGIDPGQAATSQGGGFTLEPQGMPIQNFFQAGAGGWGPIPAFGPGHQLGPGPVANIPEYNPTDPATWFDAAPAGPTHGPIESILPPAACPTMCPVTVRADLCAPPRRPPTGWENPDEFGDPAFSPPGVRIVPEWEPAGVKTATGAGQTLVGPGGQFVFPTPKLSGAPRGPVVPAGEAVGVPGLVSRPASRGIRLPWWAWVAAGLVVLKVMGGR